MDGPPPLTTVHELAAGDNKEKLWRVLNSGCIIKHNKSYLMKIAIRKNNYFLIARLLNCFPQFNLNQPTYLRLILMHSRLSTVRLLSPNLRLDQCANTAYEIAVEIGSISKFNFLFRELKLKIENSAYLCLKAIIHKQSHMITLLIEYGYVPTHIEFLLAYHGKYYNGMIALLDSPIDKKDLLENHIRYKFTGEICSMIAAKM